MEPTDWRDFFETTAPMRVKWNRKNRFYHRCLQQYYTFIIPPDKRILELGCGTGDLLRSVNPAYGVGLDFSETIVNIAKNKHPDLRFILADAVEYEPDETFDYIILSDLLGSLWDVQRAFHNLRKACHQKTRIVISNYNFMWEPANIIAEKTRFKLPQPRQNWLSSADILALLRLEGFENVTVTKKLLFPFNIPGISYLINHFAANLPLINSLNLVNLIVARPVMERNTQRSVSIIIPAKNEFGNIENAIIRTPAFGLNQEFIFVYGESSDGTFDEMIRVKEKYPQKDIKVLMQTGKGKGNAVRDGFGAAGEEVLMILDADLTVPPEDLPKFYKALIQNKGDFINGCRLVYPLQKQSMRILNYMANKMFGGLFSWILGQRLKDTLCGTKVLFKDDYNDISKNRDYFGDFDPFGDFDLLFGASKLNLKIVEINIRYRERDYGTTQISRFKHGWLLVKMSFFAARKIKFTG
jgi:SAM-dependent methyltransferase